MSDHPVPPPEVSRGKGAEAMGPAEARHNNAHSDAYARESTVTDQLRLTRGVMPEAEINARSFLGAGLLPSPGDQGITGQSAQGNTAEFNYNPEARGDRLLRATRSREGGVETLEQQYKGRKDHLDLERFRADTNSRRIERTYEKGQRADGLNSETIYRDGKTEGFERIYEPGKDKQGLLQHTFKRVEGHSEETRRFDPEKNNQKVETEIRTSEGDRSTIARTFGKGRSDGLTSFTLTSENGERTVKRSYADGAEESAVKHIDGSIDKTRSEHDGPTRKTHIEASGRSRETETYDKSGKLVSIEGQDGRGKYTATRVEDSVSGTISQRTYGDGTVATVYPKDKPGPGGASMIIQEKGKAPVSLDSQGKPIEGGGSGKPLAVATVFGENGTVRRTYSDGSSSESNLKDYTATSSGSELARNTGELARLASSPEHRQAIDGLIKAAAADGNSNPAGKALVKLAGDPSHSEAVRLSATGRLGSQNPSERQIAADLLVRIGLGSGSDSAAAIIRNPSTETAAALGRMPADQVEPHRTAIVEGLNKAATSERHGGFSADHRNAAIAVVATAGGAEALKAAGLEVKEQGDLTTVKSKDGSTLTFASEKGHLQLKSIESPAEGGIDSETEKRNFDASTGKLTSIDRSDKYGKYSETRFRETEHGTVRQRTYDETRLVRTIFGDQQILQQKGKPAETIDARGQKSTAPDSNPIGVATSFEEPGKVKSIYSDGGNKVESLHDFVERTQPRDLARFNQRFENLAARGPEESRQGSIDALVKIAASGDNGSASAVESLGRLSAEPALTDAIARTILATTNGGRAPARGSDSDQASPPGSSDRAVMLLAATTGRAGLEKAGLKVDEKGASATTSDGWKYNLEKNDKGQLRPSSVENADGSTKVEFSYARDGGFTGSVERRREASETPGQKYENVKLPPLQKGWGPYQALEQLRSEGKINMSNAEMKVEAERIRDREFKKLGRDYFKVGESFDMYAQGEKPGNQEGQGKELSISRSADGKVERMVRGDGSSVNISYENGKPSRVSDGVGPDLLSADGGKTWQFQKPETSEKDAKQDPQKDPQKNPPPYKAQLKIDPEKGTVSLEGEDRSRLEVGADGSRKFVDADGKETYIFKPPVKEPEGRTQSDGEWHPSAPGRIKRGDSSDYRPGAGKPGADGTIAQTYINQEDLHPQMLAVRNPENNGFGNMHLRGTPTISAAKIDEVLREAGSPAAKERIRDAATGKELTFGQHLYKLGVEYGIDPAVTLGFFKMESTYGKRGVAHRTHSLGNIRAGSGYRQYGSFAEGARDWFRLIQDGKHYFRKGRDTVGKIIPKYAPKSDGNDEHGYIDTVESNVRKWSRASEHASAAPQDRSREQDRAREKDREKERRRDRSELPKEDDRGKPVVEVRAGESIQKAIEKAPDGAIIHVGPGVYREQLEINRDNITLRGDGRAVIDLAGKKTSGAAVQIRDRHNVRIDGFEIRNVRGSDTPTGIRVEGASRDIVIANNNIHHVEDGQNAHGLAVYGDSSKPARNISIVNNDVHHLKLGQSESVVVNGNVDGFRITGNKIHDNDNIGIDIIGYAGTGRAGIDRARNGVVSGNHVYNIDSGKNPSYGGDRSAAGIYVDGGSDIVIEDNLIQNSNYGIELASEHRGKNTARIQVRRNRVDGSHLAGISLGGGSSSNGGVSDSIIENNDLRNNKRPVWRQHHVGSDVILRHNDSTVPPEKRTERRPERETERESPAVVPDPGAGVTRSNTERASFYRHQDDGVSCSAFSMAMMASDHLLGRPVSYGKEARSFKVLAGVTSHGYRGSLETMARQLRTTGLEARAYEYDTFGKQGMTDLNAELDKGHSAVARVRNPHTGNAHYIYIAGRTADGKYIIGDPDRHNRSHMEPVTAKHLYSMMSHRNGFVAGWAGRDSDAIRTPGTFAYRYSNNGTSLATNR
ncbi:MAG: nitrous oxide reductase family maturation protein NosD [Candidatus Obscuribacterales bacterium]